MKKDCTNESLNQLKEVLWPHIYIYIKEMKVNLVTSLKIER